MGRDIKRRNSWYISSGHNGQEDTDTEMEGSLSRLAGDSKLRGQ